MTRRKKTQNIEQNTNQQNGPKLGHVGSSLTINQHDIILRLTKQDNRTVVECWFQDELGEVFNYLIQKHGEMCLKFNWFSPDAVLFYPTNQSNTPTQSDPTEFQA